MINDENWTQFKMEKKTKKTDRDLENSIGDIKKWILVKYTDKPTWKWFL